MSENQKPKGLKREVGRNGLLLYGLGNIIGAGIYVLVGKIAERADYLAPISFLVAALATVFTAFSYAELAKILAVTAAEPVYAYKAFKKRWLSMLIGFALFGSAIVSAGVLALSFTGYFNSLFNLPDLVVAGGIISILTFTAIKGAKETVRTAAILTITEVIGLLIIVVSAFVFVDGFGGKFNETLTQIPKSLSIDSFPVIMSGAFLAFYAFIGFEDMMALAEEVENPKKSFPYAILGSIGAASVLYILVATVAMTVIPPNLLGRSEAPLADVFQTATGWPPLIMALIGIAAITNGLLAHIVMGSRMLYGLAKQGWISGQLQDVGESNTPVMGTVLVAAVVFIAAWLVPLERLAETTSLLLLSVFTVTNASLIVLRKKRKMTTTSKFRTIAPWAGIFVSLIMIVARLSQI